MNDTICYSLISVLWLNKSVTCRCQHTTVGYLTEDKKSKSKKGHNSKKKMYFKLSPLVAWIALWIVNAYFKFRVNIFSNNRYYKL